MRREARACRRPETDELALEHRQRAPHRVALAEHGPVGGHQLGLLVDDGARAPGDPRGAVARRRRRRRRSRRSRRARAARQARRRSRRPCAAHRAPAGRPTRAAALARGAASAASEREWWKRAQLRRRRSAGSGRHRLYYRNPWRSGRRDRALERAARRGPRRTDGSSREAREGPRAGAHRRAPAGARTRELLAALARRASSACTSHQAEALDAAWAGPTIITTGTASGKSLCFNLPTLDVLCRDARARALYLYPTKALAQDQARALAAFGLGQARPARDLRRRHAARGARRDPPRRANLVLTNPDMLHVGILPNHGAWADLFANLAVVVVDEAHVYRGVFGSHVANVLRRLRRIAAAYGTEPRFMLASRRSPTRSSWPSVSPVWRTVSADRPRRLAAPARRIAMWNPPLTDEALGARRSALARGGRAARAAGARGRAHDLLHEVAQGRRAAEPAGQRRPRDSDPELAELVVPYRAGTPPSSGASSRGA